MGNHTGSTSKILSRKGSASILKTKWEAFTATPELTKCPGDLTEWTVELSEEEKLIDIASIRLDVVGNVNMATFYASRVWGAEFSKPIPRTLSNTESLLSTGDTNDDDGKTFPPGAVRASPLLCLPVDGGADLDTNGVVGQFAVESKTEEVTCANVEEINCDDDNDNECYDDDFD